MGSKQSLDFTRPYLVIPKLIEQPTWGGQYIVTSKGWIDRPGYDIKIGQSYELFSGSNLSLLNSSEDSKFAGEIVDRNSVATQTNPENSLPLGELVHSAGKAALGTEVMAERGSQAVPLIKFTQALGNSFQTHIKVGVTHPKWKPKPESWYYFEPGLITLGIKADTNWQAYQDSVAAVDTEMRALGERVASGRLSYSDAQPAIASILEKYNPWRFVNMLPVKKDQLVDLSAGGIHHSWEEDAAQAPLGNVLYELQAEALDGISTFRNFDKGKMGNDGSIRDVHLKEYFEFIDRSPEANNPASHVREPQIVAVADNYRLERLLGCPYFNLDKLTLLQSSASFAEPLKRYKHLFVKSGKVTVTAGGVTITLTTGHSCFIPAAAGEYTVQNLADSTEILVTY